MISKTSILLLLLSFIAIASAISVSRVTIADIGVAPGYFVQTKQAKSNEFIKFKIFLKQQNLAELEERFWDVSNPKSSNYGKYLSAEEIDAIIAPSADVVKTVVSWLKDNNVNKNEMIVHSDYIQVRINVGKASTLFETSFAHYVSTRSTEKRIRVVGEASVPAFAHQHIDLIVGLSDFIEDSKMPEIMRKSAVDVTGTTVSITPSVIRSYYGIPANEIGQNSENSISIAAFDDFYSDGALKFFDQHFGIENVNVNAVGTNCIAEQCDQFESDLDVQYITAIGNNISTLFLSSGNGEWVLDWGTAIQLYNPIPKVSSMSYGFSEIDQCLLTTSCGTLGIDFEVYIERSNTEFQKIGLRGASILVSSGDDGSPGFYSASGNCPIDGTKHYCPLGGCQHTSSQCPSITIMESNGTACFFPMGTGGTACQSFLNNQNIVDAINAFVSQNSAKCKLSVEQDSQQNDHLYSACQCSDLSPYADAEAGVKITGYSYDQDAGVVFQPDYPTSSPYVTSVGATQITALNQPETVCSTATGAIITGGGGFAVTQPQPSYQAAAVSKYLQSGSLPPSYTFNASNRAYPDITLVGHAYTIAVTKDQTSPQCPCELTSVDGTSCSSPTVAGLFSLINDKRLSAGKSALGFLNPFLYQAAQEQPNVFNDITLGNNNCNRAYCCEYGYSAVQGYDAASGLGSINYENMLAYALSLN